MVGQMERQAKDGTVYKQVGSDEWTPVTRTAKDGTVYKKMGEDAWTPLDVSLKQGQDSTKNPTDERSALEIFKDATNVLNWPANIAASAKKIDEYTGAPIRKFVTEAVTGKDLEKAPTGADQAKMMGATDKTYGEVFGLPPQYGGNISPADIYGVALEVVQDPFTIASAAKKGFQVLSKTATPIVEGISAKQAIRSGQTQAAEATAQAAAKSGATLSGGGMTVEQGGKLFDLKAPQSLDELRNWNVTPGAGELVGKDRLKQIESNITDLKTKPLKYHYDMMENPKAMKELKLKFENLPTDDAKKIAAYNQEIVNESAKKVKSTVDSISKNKPKNLIDAGDDFISVVKDKYKAEKDLLKPVFEQLKEVPPSSTDEMRDLAIAIGENTKIGKLMSVSEDGKIFLNKNTPRSGISDAEHSVLSRVIDDMNNGMTFKEMQDVREFLRKSLDPINPGGTAEINAVRSVMLDQMEHKAAQLGPSVRDTFKAYAKNERTRENIEKIIGGKVESLDAMFSANPERVVNKVFSNPNYAKIVSEYVGQDKMQDLVASYVNNGVKKAYDSAKGFQPHTLKNWLKSNDQFLTNYVAPEVKQRLNDLADYGYFGKRFLDEVNPSGTTASLVSAIEPKGFFQKVSKDGITAAVRSETVGRVDTKLKQSQAIEATNELLGTPKVKKDYKNTMKKLSISGESMNRAAKFQKSASAIRALGNESSKVRSSEEKPTKGPDKWANDGIEMIQRSGANLDRKVLEKLKETPKGKKLLIEASSAKNEKAMAKVLEKIRTATKQENE